MHTSTQQRIAIDCLCCDDMSPNFLIWNNLYDMVYQPHTKNHQNLAAVAFSIRGHVTARFTTKHRHNIPNLPPSQRPFSSCNWVSRLLLGLPSLVLEQYLLGTINQLINQSINQLINQSINQSTKQSTNQPTKQPTNQSQA